MEMCYSRELSHIAACHTMASLTSFYWLLSCGIQFRFITESDLVFRGSKGSAWLSVLSLSQEEAVWHWPHCWSRETQKSESERQNFGMKSALCSEASFWGPTDLARVKNWGQSIKEMMNWHRHNDSTWDCSQTQWQSLAPKATGSFILCITPHLGLDKFWIFILSDFLMR